MPLGDDIYVDAALDAVVDSWPATGAAYHLYSSNPQLQADITDVELTSDGGYAAVTFDPADWAAASTGGKTTTADVSFGTSTGAYSDVAPYWGIVDSGGLLVFSDDLPDPIEVTASGTVVGFSPTLSFGDA
jgi:hypothetical protein